MVKRERAIERRDRGILEKSDIENREKVLILMCDVYKMRSTHSVHG